MQTLQTRGESNSSMLAHCEKWEVWIPMFKESNSRANEGKRQFNRSIIYNLDSIVRVNDKKISSFLGNFFKIIKF